MTVTHSRLQNAYDVLDPKLQDIQAGDDLSKNLRSQNWRLTNLYCVKDPQGKHVRFRLRPAQKWLLDRLHSRNIILKARRLGFTTMACIYALDQCLWMSHRRCGIIAHTREDATRIFRDIVKYAYWALPESIRKWRRVKRDNGGELLLNNDSSIRVGVSFRSATAHMLHVSEFGKICSRFPDKAREIVTGGFPAVHPPGKIIVESTAEGRSGRFFEMCRVAKKRTKKGVVLHPLEFRLHFFPWWLHEAYSMVPEGVVVPERIAEYCQEISDVIGRKLTPGQVAWYAATEGVLGTDMKREHPSTPQEAFEQSVEGTFYRHEIERMYREDRVGKLIIDKRLPVNTAWDIGWDDQTTIWFFQDYGDRVHLVNYYSNSLMGMAHYLEYVDKWMKKSKGRPGRYIGPHDMAVHEWGVGRTRIETAMLEHSVMFEAAPKMSILDGIEAVRRMLNTARIDPFHCSYGLDALKNYRREWDADNEVWKKAPLHDKHSHGADALRVMAVSRSTLTGSVMGDGLLMSAAV